MNDKWQNMPEWLVPIHRCCPFWTLFFIDVGWTPIDHGKYGIWWQCVGSGNVPFLEKLTWRLKTDRNPWLWRGISGTFPVSIFHKFLQSPAFTTEKKNRLPAGAAMCPSFSDYFRSFFTISLPFSPKNNIFSTIFPPFFHPTPHFPPRQDTEATRAELAAIFGGKVADLVHRLTDEEGEGF